MARSRLQSWANLQVKKSKLNSVFICIFLFFSSIHSLSRNSVFISRFDEALGKPKVDVNAQLVNDQEEIAQMENIFDSFDKSGARSVCKENYYS